VAGAAELISLKVLLKQVLSGITPRKSNKFENRPNIAEIHGTIAVSLIHMVSHSLPKRACQEGGCTGTIFTLLMWRLLLIRDLT
jgi:hypothetical protein